MPAPTSCPKCGNSTFFDNRAKNMDRVAAGQKPRPDWKCRNQSCDWVQWPAKNGAAPVEKAVPVKTAYNTPKALPNELDGYEQEETAELHAHTGNGSGVTPKIAEAANLWNAARIQVLGYAPDFAKDWQALNAAIATILIQSGKAA